MIGKVKFRKIEIWRFKFDKDSFSSLTLKVVFSLQNWNLKIEIWQRQVFKFEFESCI